MGIGLHLGDGRLVRPAGRMKGHARWGIGGLAGGLRDAVGLVTIATRRGLKHPIDHADMKMHMRVQNSRKMAEPAATFEDSRPMSVRLHYSLPAIAGASVDAIRAKKDTAICATSTANSGPSQ